MWCIYMWSLQCVSSYRNEWMNESHLNEWITSQCIAMHHITSHHITSHHITSHHIIAMCIVPGWSRAGKSCESCRVWWVMWVMSCQTTWLTCRVRHDMTHMTHLYFCSKRLQCDVIHSFVCGVSFDTYVCQVCHLMHLCVRCVIWCMPFCVGCMPMCVGCVWGSLLCDGFV